MPVISCRFPMSRKAASFVVSSGGHRLDQAQSDVGGQFPEEAAAVAEEHGNLMKDDGDGQCGEDLAHGVDPRTTRPPEA